MSTASENRRRYRVRKTGREIAREKALFKNFERGQNDDPLEYVKVLDLLRQEWRHNFPDGTSSIKIFSAFSSNDEARELYSYVCQNISKNIAGLSVVSCSISGLKFKELYHILTVSTSGHYDLRIHTKKVSVPDFDAVVVSSISDNGEGEQFPGQAIVTTAASLMKTFFGNNFLFTEIFSGTCRHSDGKLTFDPMIVGPFTGGESIHFNEKLLTSFISLATSDDASGLMQPTIVKIGTLLNYALNDNNMSRYCSIGWTIIEAIVGPSKSLNKVLKKYKESPDADDLGLRALKKFYILRNGFVHHGIEVESSDEVFVRAFILCVIRDCLNMFLLGQRSRDAMEYTTRYRDHLKILVS